MTKTIPAMTVDPVIWSDDPEEVNGTKIMTSICRTCRLENAHGPATSIYRRNESRKADELKMKQTLELRNDMAELDRLQRFVEKLGKQYCLSKKCIVEINLALEEVFANIVAYGYGDRGDHSIKISVESPVDESIAMRIEDKGRPFNPLQVAEPEPLAELENRGIGGLGIHLVKKVMDNVSYDHRGHKNVLEMTKFIL